MNLGQSATIGESQAIQEGTALKTEKHLLTRRNLRDLIILCCFASSALYGHSVASMVIGFSLLAVGCFLHVVAKGILIRNVVLCDGGVYAMVRHPYYLANYLIDCSFCVLSGNPLSVRGIPVSFLLVIRAHAKEGRRVSLLEIWRFVPQRQFQHPPSLSGQSVLEGVERAFRRFFDETY